LSGPKTKSQAWPGFEFDRQALAAQIAAARKDWQLAAATPEATVGELPALVRKLDRLRRLEQEFRRTLETEKLDALKELAYGAGHEINNPLANISARAQTLLQLERDPDRRRMLAAINTQAYRAHEMIADMMLFARPPQPRLESVELAQLVSEVVAELKEQTSAQHTELVFEAPARSFVVRADKTQIAVALRAVCVNALEALVRGGHIEIELHEAAALRKGAQITISDDGPGFSDEVRRHIFDPFYSGREAGRGLGFGLTKCWRIVTMHGGQVDVESSPGKGARFAITLPMPLDR
jgi:signal transduction histidine kinase